MTSFVIVATTITTIATTIVNTRRFACYWIADGNSQNKTSFNNVQTTKTIGTN